MNVQIAEMIKRKGLDADIKALLVRMDHLLDRDGNFTCGGCESMSICGACEMLHCFSCMDGSRGDYKNGVYICEFCLRDRDPINSMNVKELQQKARERNIPDRSNITNVDIKLQ